MSMNTMLDSLTNMIKIELKCVKKSERENGCMDSGLTKQDCDNMDIIHTMMDS